MRELEARTPTNTAKQKGYTPCPLPISVVCGHHEPSPWICQGCKRTAPTHGPASLQIGGPLNLLICDDQTGLHLDIPCACHGA